MKLPPKTFAGPSRLLLLALLLATAAAGAVPQRPNIILVMPDDVGYGDYACLGNPIMRTPAVDGFKKESLLFTQFHVSPTCAPTRSALMSGRHEFKNGVTHTILERERMAPSTFTLPQMLKTVGYATGIFGKWHLGDEAAYQPDQRGFDEVYIHGGGGIGQTYPGSCGDAPGNTNINPTLWHNGRFERTSGYCTDLFFAAALQWIEAKRQGSEPFFAYIPLNAAHGPHVVPEAYYQHYLGRPGVDEDTAKFLGMVENVDTNFGRLLAKLQEWGLRENTLVIYLASDNGGTSGRSIFNAGMRAGKNTPYQGGTRVPCFFRWPAGAVPAGAETDALAAHLDLYPTLAEITGATLPPEKRRQLEGRSLLPLLTNPRAPWADRTLVHHVGRWAKGKAEAAKYSGCAIQNSRFTLVNNAELYDLKADPGETMNVIAAHPEVVTSLRTAYEQWWREVQPLLVNENVTGIPNINPFQERYYRQFGGSPTPEALRRMDPNAAPGGGGDAPAPRKQKAKAST
ncbi:MAG: Arylsulfatase [Verrucomicrobiota bacterium]|jgi:arylsulfatase